MKYRALLDQMITTREYLLQSMKGLAEEQLLTIPDGFNNNILWNVGHAITDNAAMLYPPTGQSSPLSETYWLWFAPGTSPVDWSTTPQIDQVLNAGAAFRDTLIEDCAAGRMEEYEPLQLDDGAVLSNIAYAIAHCNTHEAVHLGIILAMRKLV